MITPDLKSWIKTIMLNANETDVYSSNLGSGYSIQARLKRNSVTSFALQLESFFDGKPIDPTSKMYSSETFETVSDEDQLEVLVNNFGAKLLAREASSEF